MLKDGVYPVNLVTPWVKPAQIILRCASDLEAGTVMVPLRRDGKKVRSIEAPFGEKCFLFSLDRQSIAYTAGDVTFSLCSFSCLSLQCLEICHTELPACDDCVGRLPLSVYPISAPPWA